MHQALDCGLTSISLVHRPSLVSRVSSPNGIRERHEHKVRIHLFITHSHASHSAFQSSSLYSVVVVKTKHDASRVMASRITIRLHSTTRPLVRHEIIVKLLYTYGKATKRPQEMTRVTHVHLYPVSAMLD